MSQHTTRNGKIARLPAALREQLNQRMYDGCSGTHILQWLNALPEVVHILETHFKGIPVSKENLSHWRKKGYREWRARREQTERLRLLSDYCLEIGRTGGSIAEGAAAIAGGKILAALEQLDEAAPDILPDEDPADPDAGAPSKDEAAAAEDAHPAHAASRPSSSSSTSDTIEKLIALSQALARLRDADSKMIRARVSIRSAEQKDTELSLAERRFQRETGELFLKFYKDKRVREIAGSKKSMEVKMDQLVELMFGAKPAVEMTNDE